MPELRREEAASLSKSEHQQPSKAVHTESAAYVSVRNLVKASNLSVSKVRQFLLSKRSYTKTTLVPRKFKRMKAFARFKYEVCCMDLAYVDNLAKGINGVRYLLFRQDLFDRIVNDKGLKQKTHKKL